MSDSKREAIVVNVEPSPAGAFRTRCVTYLFTARRAELLARVSSVVLANVYFLFRLGTSSDNCLPARPGPWVGVLMLSSVVWFAWPFFRGLRMTAKDARKRATKVSIHDEGFVADGLWGSFAASWSAIRGVRRQGSGIGIVLDSTSLDVPEVPGPTIEAILAIFRQSRITTTSAAEPDERGPYRAAARLPVTEDAAPEEWEAAPGFPHHVLVFPSRVAIVRGYLRMNPKPILIALTAIAAPMLPLWVAEAESAVSRAFTSIAMFLGLFTFQCLAHAIARAWVVLGDREIVERKKGVLYAVGGSGLYVRSHHFEQRVSWSGVRAVKRTRRAFILETDDAVHVIARSAFRREEERAAFERVVQFEIDARKPPEPAA